MIACPTPQDLRALLEGLHDEARASSFRGHLRTCDSCQALLDRLTDDTQLDSWIGEAGPAASRSARSLVREAVARAATAWAPDSIGPFALGPVLGRGGMGIVYRATDPALGREVALKAIRPDLAGPEARLRFIREVRAAARVEHDHIARVYRTSDPDDPLPYLAMELIDGPSLADRIEASGTLPPAEAAEFARQAALGLSAAHAAGIVHRDIKPANLLIEGSTGRLKIVDFGLARLSEEPGGPTQPSILAGTPAYVSPEVASGRSTPAGPAADIYALGVTLYESLAGEPPFRGTPHRVLQQILEDDPRPPRELNDRIPADLQTICLKALEKDPTRRYASAADLAADLARWQAGEPILARPIGPAGRLWRRARRRPLVSSLSALLLVATAAGTAGIFWQWRRAEAHAAQARDYLSRALDAIDVHFTQVADSSLLNVPGLQPLRKELLSEATDTYEALLRESPSDPRLRAELALARARLALITASIGSHEEAIRQLSQSIDDLDALVAQSPGEADVRDDRIHVLLQLAYVQIQESSLDDASATIDRLFELCTAEARARPGAEAPLKGLYAAQHDRGTIALRREKFTDAATSYEQANDTNRRLLAIRPDWPAYVRNTSRTSSLLADAYFRSGRPEEAARALDEGHVAALRLLQIDPDSLEYRFAMAPYEVGLALRALRESVTLLGEPARAKLNEARDHARKAVELVRTLVRENPGVDIYRSDLIGHLNTWATIELASGRTDLIRDQAREAREVLAGLRNTENSNPYARAIMGALLLSEGYALHQDGQLADALASLDEADAFLRSLSPTERASLPDQAYLDASVACGRALILASEGRFADSVAESDRAAQALPGPLAPLIRGVSAAVAFGAETPDPALLLAALPLAHMMASGGPLAAIGYDAYARLHALASALPDAPETAAPRAVFFLEKAAQGGYYREPSRLDRLLSDPAFAPLAPRPDFASFLARARDPQ